MLLIPFVENAFKHGVSYVDKSEITISIKIIENDLMFLVQNNIHVTNIIEKPDSGIGLANVQRRLSLLYPDKHKIAIKNNNDEFKVVLKISLEKC